MSATSLLVQVHVLSTSMAALLLLPFFIYPLTINQNLRKIWIPPIKVVVGTIVPSANVIEAFLALVPNNHLAANTESGLSCGGLCPRVLWHNEYGIAFAYTLPIFVSLIVAWFVYVITHHKKDKLNTFVTIWDTVLLEFSSSVFPWGLARSIFPSLKSCSQFPFRLTVAVYPLILLGMTPTANHLLRQGVKPRVAGTSLVVVLLLEVALPNIITNHVFTAARGKDAQIQTVVKVLNSDQTLKILKWHYLPDYLPTKDKPIDQNAAYLYKINVVDQYQKFNHKVAKNGDLILSWKEEKDKDIVLPAVLYEQSELTVNSKKFASAKNVIGNPITSRKSGLNRAVLHSIVSTWFYVISAISLVAWLSVLAFYLWKKFINNKSDKTEAA